MDAGKVVGLVRKLGRFSEMFSGHGAAAGERVDVGQFAQSFHGDPPASGLLRQLDRLGQRSAPSPS